jgi:hypothetical protein
MPETVLNIGRFGDIIGLLPYCYARRNDPVTMVVGHEFADILDAVSYVKRLKYSQGCIMLHDATKVCKKQFPDVKVAQVFINPDQRHLTDSFAKESYRLIGALNEYGTQPTVFDQRDYEAEAALAADIDKNCILVAGTGISSPFEHDLIQPFQEAFPKYRIVDMNRVKANKIQHLLGMIDRAALLVTIDTVHLWLAKASRTPVVAFCNDGWRGSPPPETTIATMRYGSANVPLAAREAARILSPAGRSVMVVDGHGNTPRHKKARKSWNPDLLIQQDHWGRDASDIGDRPLPYLKDLLRVGLQSSEERDIIIWTNGDVTLHHDCIGQLKQHVGVFGAVGVRRHARHIGRELFAFERAWLRDHLSDMPDGILGRPWFDLAIAAYIRRTKGIKSTLDNLAEDRWPCEIEPGILTHEDHESGWLQEKDSPAAKNNERLFRSMV